MIEYFKQTDLAWVAGIIDGEGCIHIKKDVPTAISRHRSVNYALILKVSMTHRPTIERLQAVFGFGSVRGSSNKVPGNKPAWHWTCSSNEARAVLLLVLPWLVTKREEARTGVRMLDLGSARGGHKRVPEPLLRARGKLYSRLRSLKKYTYPVGAKTGAPFPSCVVVFRG